MKLHGFSALVLAAAAALLTDTAAFAAPTMCSSGDGLSGYNQGYELESSSLRSNFKTFFTCGSVESFIQAVRVNLTGVGSSDRYLQCRDIGIIQAMDETIRSIAYECGKMCTDSGASIGRMKAEQYCGILDVIVEAPPGAEELIILAPIPTCDLATEQACRSAFESTVNSHSECEAHAARDRRYRRQLDQACKFLR